MGTKGCDSSKGVGGVSVVFRWAVFSSVLHCIMVMFFGSLFCCVQDCTCYGVQLSHFHIERCVFNLQYKSSPALVLGKPPDKKATGGHEVGHRERKPGTRSPLLHAVH